MLKRAAAALTVVLLLAGISLAQEQPLPPALLDQVKDDYSRLLAIMNERDRLYSERYASQQASVAAALASAEKAVAKAQEPPQALPPGCGPLQGFLAHLQAKYSEFRIIELEFNGGKFVVTRSNEGAWTVLKTEGADAACVIAAGDASEVDRGF